MRDINLIEKLAKLRSSCGAVQAKGLSDEVIQKFASNPHLQSAVADACKNFEEISKEFADQIKLGEKELIANCQSGFLNFYPADSISPYLPIAASGPWIVSLYGGVFYDTGGYGMLGQGHSPSSVLEALSRDYVMANVMTASFSQQRFMKLIRSKIGVNRPNQECPYSKFVCMNSGSESMTVAARISDRHARIMTDPDGKHAGKTVVALVMQQGFHGRTYRPARFSDSTRGKYEALASFRNHDDVLAVKPNDLQALKDAFGKAEQKNLYVEAVIMEPVMGEGNPGLAITPEYYSLARELTKQHDSYLIIDAIQAGLRVQGVLSIVDYPGFEQLPAPDMETYSKALNAGQFPLSVLAVQQHVADIYSTGLYGNTMTTNPRGLEVGCAVLAALTPELTSNIRKRGEEMLSKLAGLKKEFPKSVVAAQGTGLLLSLELVPDIPVTGFGGVEEWMRINGVNVIHGGKNSLRFTPWFNLDSVEIDLIVDCVRSALGQFGN